MSTYTDASLIYYPSGYKESKAYSLKPTDGSGDLTFTRASSATRVNEQGLIETASVILPTELITNGDFATDTDWNKGTGWTISSGIANFNTTNNQNLSQSGSYVGGKTYKVLIDVVSYTRGNPFIAIGQGSNVNIPTTIGLHTLYVVSGGVDTLLRIYSGSAGVGGEGSIDNVSVKEVITNNVPRIDYTGGGCAKLLLEPQRSNLVLQSEDISSASWTKNSTPTITSNIAIAPDGTTSADGIQSLTGGAYRSITQNFTVASNSTVTGSVFVKKEISETFYGGFSILFQGGTTKVLYVIVDAVNGTGTISGSTLTGTIKVEDYNNYWRISATTTDNGSNTICRFTYEATLSTNGTTLNPGAGSVRTIWGFQTELGSYATSYIPTTTTAVTRTQDSATKSGISSLIGQTEGVLYAEIAALDLTNSLEVLSLSDGTFNNVVFFRYYDTSSNDIQVQVKVAGVIQVSILVTLTNAKDLNKIAFKYKENDFALWVNGVNVGTDISGSTFAANTLSKFAFDRGDGSNPMFANVQNLMVFPSALSDTDLATLTTL